MMASILWDACEVLLLDYLDKGHTVNGAYYADLLAAARENQTDSAWKAAKRSALPPVQCSGMILPEMTIT